MSDIDQNTDKQEIVKIQQERLMKNGKQMPKGFIPWAPGQSGNPSGKSKMTPEQKEMMNEIRSLGPKCVKAMNDILDGRSALARVRMIEIILSYIIGKPESNVKVEISTEERVAQSELRIAALVQSIKLGGIMTDGEYGSLGEPSGSVEISASDREHNRIPGPDEPSQQVDP